MDPRWNPNQKTELLEQRQPGPESGEDFRVTQVETNKRRISETAAAQVAALAPAPSDAPQKSPITPIQPPATLGPDRLHKEALSAFGGYVFVARDHDASEKDQLPPMNPGYAPTATASSLNAGYVKALSMAMKFNSRVALIVLGGSWFEDLACISGSIDVIGQGRPIINGHVTILPTCSEITFANFRIISTDLAPAMLILPGTPGLQSQQSYDYSLTRLIDVWMECAQTAYQSQRRVYLWRCETNQTSQILDYSVETASALFIADLGDQGLSLAEECKFRAFELPVTVSGAVTQRTPYGYAVKATSKVGGAPIMPPYPGIAGGEVPEHLFLPNSGLELRNCEVMGSLINEYWNVTHEGGEQIAGFPYPDVRGGVYCIHRGWCVIDGFDGLQNFIHARTWWYNTRTYCAQVASSVKDNAQHAPLVCGGYTYFNNSTHVPPVTNAAAQAFSESSAPHEGYVLNSSSASLGWGVTPANVFNSPLTSAPGLPGVKALFNPFKL